MRELEALFVMFAPLLATLVNVTAHLGLTRMRVRGTHLGPLISAFLIGLAVNVTITGWVAGQQYHAWMERVAIGVVNMASYGGLGYCYFTVINLVFTSLRVRIIGELLESPDHSLPADRLKAVYDLDTILNKRLERLVAWGQVYSSGNRYYLAGTPAFLVLDQQIRRIRKILTGSEAVDDRKRQGGAPQ